MAHLRAARVNQCTSDMMSGSNSCRATGSGPQARRSATGRICLKMPWNCVGCAAKSCSSRLSGLRTHADAHSYDTTFSHCLTENCYSPCKRLHASRCMFCLAGLNLLLDMRHCDRLGLPHGREGMWEAGAPAGISANHPQDARVQELTGGYSHCPLSALLCQVSSLHNDTGRLGYYSFSNGIQPCQRGLALQHYMSSVSCEMWFSQCKGHPMLRAGSTALLLW